MLHSHKYSHGITDYDANLICLLQVIASSYSIQLQSPFYALPLSFASFSSVSILSI